MKFTLKLTFRQNKILKDDKNVKKLHPEHRFDFLIKISDKTIETLITNLDFPADELKKLYNMRWGIETSFRDLKHTL